MSRERLNTRNPTRKLVLIILGYATWGREVVRERPCGVIANAKAGGRYQSQAPAARQGDQDQDYCGRGGETGARGQAAWSGAEQRLQSARGWPTGARCAGHGRLIVRGGAPGAWSACSLS
jgi:hypothetical protein